MDVEDFRATLLNDEPPSGLSLALQTLWWDAKGDWKRAHQCAQQEENPAGARVHAYLHREEGDLSNARYWYQRAGVQVFDGSLDDEWEHLAGEFLGA